MFPPLHLAQSLASAPLQAMENLLSVEDTQRCGLSGDWVTLALFHPRLRFKWHAASDKEAIWFADVKLKTFRRREGLFWMNGEVHGEPLGSRPNLSDSRKSFQPVKIKLKSR